MFSTGMQLEVIGPHPFTRDAQGQPVTRIGTVFPAFSTLYTGTPAVHAWQRVKFIEHLNSVRAAKSIPPLTAEEEQSIATNSVDLVFESDQILIRPDPACMELAFAADELLQQLVSKRHVRFLSVSDSRIREAIKRRGECWRLSSIPKDREAKIALVLGSKVAIQGRPIYYYNRLTGTRWLTFHEFSQLAGLDDSTLASHLQEIGDYALRRNRLDRPELAFFGTEQGHLGLNGLAGVNYLQLPQPELRAKYGELRTRFETAAEEALRKDDCQNSAWNDRMLSTLFLDGNEAQTEQILGGLSPEFYLQIDWLAGGRFESGEFLLDPVFEEAAAHPEDRELQRLCDPRAKNIIFNFIRDYGDIEYINLGCLRESLSLDRPQKEGRRVVFLAEFQALSEPAPIKRFLRLQKWGVWEHLDEKKPLLESILESDEYTDYWLDRRLGCLQLGMNLCRRLFMRRLNEIYQGSNAHYRGRAIRTTYFEREYLPGIATDKILSEQYARPGYAKELAALLGRAAASSLIVGRSFDGSRAAFDDGDEVVREGADSLPIEIMLGDHSGAFTEYKRALEDFAADYARPVNSRKDKVDDIAEFAREYLKAFSNQFRQIQDDYRKRRPAFDRLFKHCPYDPAGSFAYRWECVLRRLDKTDPDSLVNAIRRHIGALNPPDESQGPSSKS